ncbi:hypothetical protein H5410_013459 [Solanum commersonii]|uniref:NPH3 domain-containing protein n=1 Tax=Solanum commersonii TaxID=4109 RepID=A0A9J6AV58_SOLCO|nr:hypothetical protein H5410_013459 [Solanum commersonii]
MRKITSLIDLNITEVAPHPCLKPSKCLALVRSLPSLLGTRMMQYTMPRLCILSRMLSEVKKMKVCTGLSYEKLSFEACSHLARKLDLSIENEKLKEHLQGMQWRVLELEKVCRKIQNQIVKILKSRVSSHNYARSLPRLCS